jgi:hypothetical protein
MKHKYAGSYTSEHSIMVLLSDSLSFHQEEPDYAQCHMSFVGAI